MGSDWTELYRPTNLDEVVGNPKAVKELRDWALQWERGKPVKKAAVLMGVPGTGKTSSALALANEFGWGVVEMNASDQRNADAIKSIALRGALADTFSDDGSFLSSREGRRKLIILDEADNIFGKEDRGGIPAISELIRRTNQPVILIVNDFYELRRRSSYIASNSRQIKFNRIGVDSIRRVLEGIATSEGVKVSDRALNMIAENANGDLRAAVRDFQSVAMGRRELKEEDLLILENRFVSKSVQELIYGILKSEDPGKARSMMMDVDETPDHILLWIDENMPIEYAEPADLYAGYEMLSRSDIFLGRVRRRQYYGFWSYASDLMSYGVAAVKRRPYRGYSRFRFPSYLIKMSRSRGQRVLQARVAAKIGDHCHASAQRAREDLLEHFAMIFRTDRDFRVGMTLTLDLEQEEAAFLLNEKVDSSAVKHLMSEVDKVRRIREAGRIAQIERVTVEPTGRSEESEDVDDDSGHQSNLFEY